MSVFVPPDSDVFQPRKSIRKKYSSAVKFRDDLDLQAALDAAVRVRTPDDRAPLAGGAQDQPADRGAGALRHNQSHVHAPENNAWAAKGYGDVVRPESCPEWPSSDAPKLFNYKHDHFEIRFKCKQDNSYYPEE
uniref:Uncharacterized protein n=1 Tax=Steinernema glaseri TaxID=37863 RepID=A0A1I7Z456_9BILA